MVPLHSSDGGTEAANHTNIHQHRAAKGSTRKYGTTKKILKGSQMQTNPHTQALGQVQHRHCGKCDKVYAASASVTPAERCACVWSNRWVTNPRSISVRTPAHIRFS